MTEYEQRLDDAEEKKNNEMKEPLAICFNEKLPVAYLQNTYEDLESRARRNNLCIYGVKEGEENNEMLGFISNLIQTSLSLPGDLNLNIMRAHRSLTMKPKDLGSPPRSIIIRFLDYRTKEMVIWQAWKHRGGVTYKGQIIFDQDYTSDIQRKCKQVKDVIKQLKENNIKAQSPFPTNLKIHLESGAKTFTTLADAARTLAEMGIPVQVDEWETLLVELLCNSLNNQTD